MVLGSGVEALGGTALRSLGSVRLVAADGEVNGEPASSPPSDGRFLVVTIALLALLPVVLVLAVSLGAVAVPPRVVWTVVVTHLTSADPTGSAIDDQIVWSLRVPRVLMAFVVGAALAVAGAVLQVVVGNPLADPYILGVSAGASLAAVGVLTLGSLGGVGLVAALGVSGAAFFGALVTLALVIALGRRQGRLDPVRVLLAGVALAYLFQALTSFLQLRVPANQLSSVLFWLLGTLSGADWADLRLPAAVVAGLTVWLLTQGRAMNALLLGDDAATSLGVDVTRLRLRLLVASAALTAVVIAVAGGVGFVGLIAPHCVRLLVGSDHRRLLPLAALTGGLFLIIADLLARTVTQPLELPISIVTAVAGVPFFLLLLRRSGRTGQDRGTV